MSEVTSGCGAFTAPDMKKSRDNTVLVVTIYLSFVARAAIAV
jgi:hypothetical protein